MLEEEANGPILPSPVGLDEAKDTTLLGTPPGYLKEEEEEAAEVEPSTVVTRRCAGGLQCSRNSACEDAWPR